MNDDNMLESVEMEDKTTFSLEILSRLQTVDNDERGELFVPFLSRIPIFNLQLHAFVEAPFST